jgi:hypothetical protein
VSASPDILEVFLEEFLSRLQNCMNGNFCFIIYYLLSTTT